MSDRFLYMSDRILFFRTSSPTGFEKLFAALETWFGGKNTAEGNNAKINVSPSISCTFLLFKASTFFKFCFRENCSFENVGFFNSKCLAFLYLLTYLFL